MIKLEIEDCKVKVTNVNNSAINKYISFETLIKILTAAEVSADSKLAEGENIQLVDIKKLLEEAISSKIFTYNNNSMILQTKYLKHIDGTWYVIYRKPTRENLVLRGKTYENVGVPAMIFGVLIINNRISKCNVACVKTDKVTEDTDLYRYPFSNIFNYGGVCWGNNQMSSINFSKIDEILYIPDMFIAMPNSEHSYDKSNNSEEDYEDLLEKSQNKDFDNDILIPLKTKYGNWFYKLL